MSSPSQSGRAVHDTTADQMQLEAAQAPDSLEVEMQVVDNAAVNPMTGVEQTRSPPLQSSDAPRSSTTSSSAEQQPSPTHPPQVGVRRSRVEEDHDDERDRRHPSQRIGNPLLSDSPSSPSPSGRPSPPTPLPGIFQLFSGYPMFQRIIHPRVPRPPSTSPQSSGSSSSTPLSASITTHTTTPTTSEQPASASQSTSTSNPVPSSAAPSNSASSDTPSHDTPPRPNSRPTSPPEYVGGFAITFDRFGNMHTMPLPMPGPRQSPHPNSENNNNPMTSQPETSQAAADDHAGSAPDSQTADPEHAGQEDHPAAAQFAEWLTGMAFLASLTGLPISTEREVEDPERAKKLIAGLEDVPIGLVRRLERVGGTGGGMGEGLSSGGDSGCAICWDKLLNETEEEDEEETNDAESSAGVEKKEKKYPRIVSLPCAHVFHADCLVPWFSRPKQTTCPTCRFNIDPDNLTYTSQAQRRRTAQAQAGREEGAPTTGENATPPIPNANVPPSQPGVGGLDIPFFTAPFPHFIPIRPNTGVPDENRASEAQLGARQPAENMPQPDQTTGRNAEGSTGPTPSPENANRTRRPLEILTIGLDIHINRGPLPPMPPIVTPAQPAPQPQSQVPPNSGPREPAVPLVSGMGRSFGEVMQQVVGSLFNRGMQGPAPAPRDSPTPTVFGPAPPPPSGPAPAQATPSSSNGETTTAADGQPQAQRQRGPPPTAHIILEGAPVLDILGLLMRAPPPTAAAAAGRPGNNPWGSGSGAPSSSATAPKRQWVPPPAPGLTLRQRIERREQEAGLRCCDVSCGVGPSDEDPWVDVAEKGMRQLSIRTFWHDSEDHQHQHQHQHSHHYGSVAAGRKPVCPHTFHSSCLVSAERVAIALRDGHVEYVGPESREVEVSCPVCRGVGTVSKEEWDEGVKALN